MRLALTADHNGTALKELLARWLTGQGHEVSDLGHHGREGEVVDYPPLCAAVCAEVLSGRAERGVVLGGSGLGETVACNKLPGIRAGLCHDEWSAGISRGNNDANVLVLAAKILAPEAARDITATWLSTPFKGGVHRRRLEQITALERDGRL